MNSEGSKLRNDRFGIKACPQPGSTVAYTAGDLIGTKMTYDDVVPNDYGGGSIKSVTILDFNKQDKALDLLFFAEDLASGTGAGTNWATGDNAALDVASSDLVNCIGVVSIGTGDYSAFNDNGVATVETDIPFYVRGKNLYGLMVARGTPAFESASCLYTRIGIERD